jgi:hypothetical protein
MLRQYTAAHPASPAACPRRGRTIASRPLRVTSHTTWWTCCPCLPRTGVRAVVCPEDGGSSSFETSVPHHATWQRTTLQHPHSHRRPKRLSDKTPPAFPVPTNPRPPPPVPPFQTSNICCTLRLQQWHCLDRAGCSRRLPERTLLLLLNISYWGLRELGTAVPALNYAPCHQEGRGNRGTDPHILNLDIR